MEELLVNTTDQMKKQPSISKGYEFTSIEIYERYISGKYLPVGRSELVYPFFSFCIVKGEGIHLSIVYILFLL